MLNKLMSPTDAYTQLIHFLDQGGARYRLIDHAPEGRTEIVSPMRGNNLSQAAKCIVVMIKVGKKTTIADPSVLINDEIYFNAARLDRSMALKSQDYAALVKPRVERIATFE